MKYSSCLHLTAAAAAVFAAMAASSSAAVAAEETVSTETVKVTAARVEQEIQEVPMSLSVVTEDEVKHSTAKTLADLLQDIPGVQVTSSGSQGLKRIKIRGEDTFRTLVMVNGQKISEQKSMDGTAILIDPANIERIEVIKGPASVLYGSDAVGGAINIITKKNASKPFEAEASVGWNEAGHGWNESMTLAGNVDRFHYRLSGSYESQDDLDTPWGKVDSTAFRQKSANAYLGYDLTDNVTVGIQADIFDSHLRAGTTSEEYKEFYVDIPSWKREKVGAFVDAKNINDYLTRIRFDAYWQKTRKEMTNHVLVNPDGAPMKMLMNSDADNRLTTLGTSLQTDWQLGDDHYLITGYEFTQDKLKATTNALMSSFFPFSNEETGDAGITSSNYTTDRFNKGKQNTHAIFASLESQLPHDLVANYGARYTYVSSEMTEAFASKNGYKKTITTTSRPPSTVTENYDNLDDGSAGKSGKNHNSRVVFNAGLTWTGIEDWALRATWAQGFRAPLLQEKYITNNMGSGSVYGNPNLKPETSNNFELGARYNHNSLNLDATIFYSLAKDYIAQERIGGTKASPIMQYFNADKAKTFGFELALSNTFFDHYTPYASVTLLRRKLESTDYSTYDTATPSLSARYGLRTNHNIFGGTLVTDTYARSQNATKSYNHSENATDRIAGFTTLNFGAGYRFGKNEMFSIDAEVINIFNQLYQYYNSTYEAGRSFNFKLTARY